MWPAHQHLQLDIATGQPLQEPLRIGSDTARNRSPQLLRDDHEPEALLLMS